MNRLIQSHYDALIELYRRHKVLRLELLFDCDIDPVESKAMRNPCFIRRVNESRTSIYAA